MAMKLVKKTDEYSIYQRSDDRYAVKDANKKPINGDEKVRILVAEELIKAALPAEPAPETDEAVEEAVAEEAPAEEQAAEEAPAEEESAEEAPADEEAPTDEAPAEEDAAAEDSAAEDEEDK